MSAKIILAAATWTLSGLLASSGCTIDDLSYEDESPRTFLDGADCSLFTNYPPVPPYDKPGDHCKHDPGDNPGCPPGIADICEVPDSGWPGPYNIYKDNCHDAASCGVDAGTCEGIDTGILSCTGNTSGIGGHTVNYSVFPGTGENEGKFVICISEPQQSNPDADKCCWVQDTSDPQTGVGEPGHACYKYHCGSQADDDGGTALPTGECWPTLEEKPCGDVWNSKALKCCQDYARRWDHSLPKWCSKKGYDTQVQFRCEAYAECVKSAGADLPWEEDEEESDDGPTTPGLPGPTPGPTPAAPYP